MKVKHGQQRPPYLENEARQRYAHTPDKVRRGYPGDKLRRKAFEGKL